jgi:hypothetical protein
MATVPVLPVAVPFQMLLKVLEPSASVAVQLLTAALEPLNTRTAPQSPDCHSEDTMTLAERPALRGDVAEPDASALAEVT